MAKWDFSDDEWIFLGVAGVATLFGTLYWYLPLLRRRSPRPAPARVLLILTPLTCLAAVYFAIQRWGDPLYVSGQADYVILFLIGGAAWLAAVAVFLPVVGISPRDDAIDRGNPAAAVFACCTLLGTAALYAGSNVGGGPTIWTTLVPAFVATLLFLASLLLLSLVSPLSDAVSIDRDVAASWRNGGVLVCVGLILGRAVAGDWTSWSSTFSDLARLSCPVLALLPTAAILNRVLLPTPTRPTPSPLRLGLVPAAVCLVLTLLYLIQVGPADIGRHVVTYEQYMKSK